VLELLTSFVGELRAAGLPVSMTETVDAAEAVRHVPVEDRAALKYALGATLVKSEAHWRTFETAFEIYFSTGTVPRGVDGNLPEESASIAELTDLRGSQDTSDKGGSRGEGLSPEDVQELLLSALLSGNEAQIDALIRHAVSRFAGMESGRPVGGTYYLYRTLRHLDVDHLLERLLAAVRGEAPDGVWTPLEERLARDEFTARLDALHAAVEAEIRRRLVADRGSQELARSVRKPLPEDVEFMHASAAELAQLRRVIHPLARKLAIRLARKRRHGHRGPLDFRATVRQSLSTGGVPVDPRFRYPRPAKPEIFVIADISGSVASFARFTLHLVHAISTQFSKVRTFVFVDAIDEVTNYFEGTTDVAEAIHRINTEANVLWVDGHSDYGHALESFWERWGTEITPRTTVLILGDARNNYHASRSWVIQEIAQRARRVSWLNPERRSYWGSGDSIVGEYGAYCHEVVECRNLRQLERFISELS
jgi:hypothetical protein